jgi:hypothetical protein
LECKAPPEESQHSSGRATFTKCGTPPQALPPEGHKKKIQDKDHHRDKQRKSQQRQLVQHTYVVRKPGPMLVGVASMPPVQTAEAQGVIKSRVWGQLKVPSGAPYTLPTDEQPVILPEQVAR